MLSCFLFFWGIVRGHMKFKIPGDRVERVVFGFLGTLVIGMGLFLAVTLPGMRIPCDDFSPLTERVHIQSKVVGEVEIAGEKCQMYNVFSEGISYEDKDRKCMLSHESPIKLVSSKIVCPSGTSVLPIELKV